VYRKYFPEVERYFASRGLDPMDADDLVQEVFQTLAQGDIPRDPRTHLYAIARNLFSRHRRRAIAERAALDEYRRHVATDDMHPDFDAIDPGLLEEGPTLDEE
jgi:DNA-directed RNA polymerase specialized sigma24 family protein